MNVRQTIVDKLTARFEPSVLEIIDESGHHHGHRHHQDRPCRRGQSGHAEGGNTHFRVRIATRHFDGLSRVAQHRLIMETLAEELNGSVHALAIEVVQG